MKIDMGANHLTPRPAFWLRVSSAVHTMKLQGVMPASFLFHMQETVSATGRPHPHQAWQPSLRDKGMAGRLEALLAAGYKVLCKRSGHVVSVALDRPQRVAWASAALLGPRPPWPGSYVDAPLLDSTGPALPLPTPLLAP